jgi:hypothetical protein
MDEDIRFPLELEVFDISTSYGNNHSVLFKFYFPSTMRVELKEAMDLYKDSLYTGINNYDIGNGQSVMTFQTPNIEVEKRELKKAIVEIIKEDGYALLYSQHPVPFIKELAAFKIKHFRKEKFTFEDIFGDNPENLFEE